MNSSRNKSNCSGKTTCSVTGASAFEEVFFSNQSNNTLVKSFFAEQFKCRLVYFPPTNKIGLTLDKPLNQSDYTKYKSFTPTNQIAGNRKTPPTNQIERYLHR